MISNRETVCKEFWALDFRRWKSAALDAVGGLEYTTCINECGYTEDDAVRLSIAIRAEYGLKSLCIVEGMANREYWHDYPDYDPTAAFSITPRVVCEIIRYALVSGWQPAQSKMQVRVHLDNEGLTAMIAKLTSDPGSRNR